MVRPRADVTRDRDPVIDMARGIAILLVIFGHSLEIFFNPKLRPDLVFDQTAFEVWRAIYAFHMPLFYFVSGMAARDIGQRSVRAIMSAALALVLLADATQFIAAPLRAVFQNGLHPIAVVKATFGPIVFGSGFALTVAWFLVSLAGTQLLAWGLLRMTTVGARVVTLALVALSCFALYFQQTYFQAQSWAIGATFFLAGRFLVTRYKTARIPRLTMFLVAVAALALLGILYSLNLGCLFDASRSCNLRFGRAFAVMMIDGKIGFVPLFLVTAFAGIAAIIASAQLLSATPLKSPLAAIGRQTLSLFMINGFVLIFLEPTLGRIVPASPGLWFWGATGLVLAHLAVVALAEPPMAALQKRCRQLANTAVRRLLPAGIDTA
jgi:fucose 4-O-acetylase-like acetyltransferase